MEIILSANEKGGTAKTATVLCLASCLTALGYRVLAIDLDPSGNLTQAALPDKPRYCLSDVLHGICSIREAIVHCDICDVLPTLKEDLNEGPSPIVNGRFAPRVAANKSLTHFFEGMHGKKDNHLWIKALVTSSGLESDYDFVLLDSPPSDNLIVTNCIVAADFVLIPCEPNASSADGLRMFINSAVAARRMYATNVKLDGLVFTKYTDEWKTRKEQVNNILEMAKAAHLHIYDTRFHLSSSIETSMNECRPILEYLYRGTGAADSLSFALEFLARRGLIPQKPFPGVLKDETGTYIYRRNGSLYYTMDIIDGKACVKEVKLNSSSLANEAFIKDVGKRVFFHKKNLDAHIAQRGLTVLQDVQASATDAAATETM